MDYKKAGVDIDSGNEAVKRIKARVRRTFTKGVLTDIGAFSGLFELDKDAYREPVLVSSTDGVGTKVMIAQMMDKHDTIGIDLVAMSVNDLICTGADPLFFLDYIACGKLVPEKIEEIVEGISRACQESDCALIGGETAEMPGIYEPEEYDLAGFAVGVVEKADIINGDKIRKGDVLIGVKSRGLHSNGYSLAREVLFKKAGLDINSKISGLAGTLGEELLAPTRIYVSIAKNLKKECDLLGIAHITGGAFYEKIIRVVPDGLGIDISRDSWLVPKIFELIREKGEIPGEEMYRTFNMGIGMAFIVPDSQKASIISCLDKQNEEAYVIGEVTGNAGEVRFI